MQSISIELIEYHDWKIDNNTDNQNRKIKSIGASNNEYFHYDLTKVKTESPINWSYFENTPKAYVNNPFNRYGFYCEYYGKN